MSLNIYLSVEPCPTCGLRGEGFDGNITHNLAKMADEAGIYGIVWRPEENGMDTAGQLIEPLRAAIEAMTNDPKRFKAHNPMNGWGNYTGFLKWLEDYLQACEKYPMATIEVSR